MDDMKEGIGKYFIFELIGKYFMFNLSEDTCFTLTKNHLSNSKVQQEHRRKFKPTWVHTHIYIHIYIYMLINLQCLSSDSKEQQQQPNN